MPLLNVLFNFVSTFLCNRIITYCLTVVGMRLDIKMFMYIIVLVLSFIFVKVVWVILQVGLMQVMFAGVMEPLEHF